MKGRMSLRLRTDKGNTFESKEMLTTVGKKTELVTVEERNDLRPRKEESEVWRQMKEGSECSLSLWRVVRGSKLMHLDSLIHGLFIT